MRARPPALLVTVLVTILVTAATLLGAVPAAATVAPGRSDTSTGTGVARAASYGRAHGVHTGVAVLDTTTGRIWSDGGRRAYPSASVVKTMIATRLLLTGRMHGAVARRARAMVSRSDNAAAWALYPLVGRDRLLPALARHYHLDGLGAPPAMPGVWGSTRITARGLVGFYAAVRRDPKVWPWLSRAMHAWTPRSSGGEPNDFGLAAAAPHAAVKNGWDTDRDPRNPSAAIVNSTGFVRADRYAVAILTEGPGRLYYAGGERIVTAVARRVVDALRPAVPPAPVPAAAPVAHAGAWRATVVLDPGHNGGNAAHLAAIDRLVYAGYGRYKPCNTTGTATDSGYPEHAFTWDVARRVRAELRTHGVRVIMTRRSDSGVGPCVDTRARIESRRGVALAVAIHADGAPSAGHGFHICVDSRRPEHASAATVARTARLDAALRRALAHRSRLTVSSYLGSNGYYRRSDLAGLNLSTNPTAFLELGNMRNAHDAALQRSAAGRARIAHAVAVGILMYLFH